jgi:hypothetical protein
MHNILDIVWPSSRLFDHNQPLWVALHGQTPLIRAVLSDLYLSAAAWS